MFLSTTPRNWACSVAVSLRSPSAENAIGPTMVLCSFSRRYFAMRLLVERPRRLDGLLDELTAGVAERRKIVAQRIDLGFHGPFRVGLEERLGPVVIHARFREP